MTWKALKCTPKFYNFKCLGNSILKSEERVAALTSFLSFVIFHVLIWNSFHAVDFNFDVSPRWDRVGDFVDRLLVDLHAVDGQARTRVQLLVADVALEVFRLLMLNQDLLVIKLSIAIPSKKN